MKIKTTWLAMRYQRIAQTCRAKRSFAIHSLTLLLLLTAGAVRALAQQIDGGMPGPYPVGHTSFVVTNSAGRPLALNVWYPADARSITAQTPEAVYVMDPYTSVVGSISSSPWEATGCDRAYENPMAGNGRFALVMFSPGWNLNGWNYIYFGARLASHGYIVAVMENYGAGFWVESFFDYPANVIYDRSRDLTFALDTMFALDQQRDGILYHRINRAHVVAAGHSLGGYAAMAVVCGDDQVCDSVAIHNYFNYVPPDACQQVSVDDRFTALMTLDGGSDLLRWNELSRIRVPSIILGDGRNADGYYNATDGPVWQSYNSRPHAAFAPHTRSVRVDIDNIEHLTFGHPCDGYALLKTLKMWSSQDYKFYADVWGSKDRLPTEEARRLITKFAVAWLHAEVVKDETLFSGAILTQQYVRAYEPAVEVWWDEGCMVPGLPSDLFSYFYGMTPGACVVGEKDPAEFFIPYP